MILRLYTPFCIEIPLKSIELDPPRDRQEGQGRTMRRVKFNTFAVPPVL
ncbi:14936_t:CDS:2 [Funneliformis caledonium]|uniref:14936_t:CDS:1 n=1 Tax=Funneliformis caledonium TaxID=1117310 RepID=A0A9N8ZYJ6_9GLOM|nr:14936_t:CDS:2 [Funneliformis caledonium]